MVCWKPDSSCLAVTTTLGRVLIYQVQARGAAGSGGAPPSVDPLSAMGAEGGSGHQLVTPAPTVYDAELRTKTEIQYGKVNCVASDAYNLLVGTESGFLLVVRWSGDVMQAMSYESLVQPCTQLPANQNLNQSPGKSPRGGVAEAPPTVTTAAPRGGGGGAATAVGGAGAMVKHGVVSIACDRERYALAFRDGSAALLTLRTKPRKGACLDFAGTLVSGAGAVCVAVNRRLAVTAVACSDGDVLLYTTTSACGGSAKAAAVFVKRLSMAHWLYRPDDVGRVAGMEWSPDGHALCVAYERRGLTVWHPSGACLFSTLSKSGPDAEPPSQREPLRDGTHIIAWGAQGYVLLAARRGAQQYYQFSFLKSVPCHAPNQALSPTVAFQGEDRLVVFRMSGTEFLHSDFEHLQVPLPYLSANHPIRHVAISADGQQYAFAGRRGVVLFNSASRRWRMFGDQAQEAAVTCVGLCWLQNAIVVVANFVEASRSFELLFYPRYHLDRASLLHAQPLTFEPLRVEAHDGLLHILAPANTVHLFHATVTGGDLVNPQDVKVSVRPVGAVQLSARPEEGTPLYFRCLAPSDTFNNATLADEDQPSAAASSLQKMPHMALVLRPSKHLVFVDLTDLSETLVSEGVHEVWVESELPDRVLFLTFDDCGTAVWSARYGSGNGGVTHTCHRLTEFDPESFPLGYMKETGVFLHASSYSTLHPCGSTLPVYEISTKLFPYVHGVLLLLLADGEEDLAAEFARSLSGRQFQQATFTRTLEWLLHTVTEDSDLASARPSAAATGGGTAPASPTASTSGAISGGATMLESVIRFLRLFPQYHEIVVSCARKTDVRMWHALFNAAGQPAQLFKECEAQGQIHDASNLLRIIQQTDSLETSRHCAVRLLPPALRTEEWELARDLIRYIHMADSEAQAAAAAEEQQQGTESVDPDGSVGPSSSVESMTFAWYPEVFSASTFSQLSETAEVVLASGRLRTLVDFCRMLQFPLHTVLRKRRAPLGDFESAFELLHDEFGLPRSNDTSGPLPDPNLMLLLSNAFKAARRPSIHCPPPRRSHSRTPSAEMASATVQVSTPDFPSASTAAASLGTPTEGMSPPDSASSLDAKLKWETAIMQAPAGRLATPPPVFAHVRSSSLGGGGGSDAMPSFVKFKHGAEWKAPTAAALETPTQVFLSLLPPVAHDLRWLLQEMTACLCDEWATLLAILLLDTQALCRVLARNSPHFYYNVLTFLALEKNGGYARLRQYLEEAAVIE